MLASLLDRLPPRLRLTPQSLRVAVAGLVAVLVLAVAFSLGEKAAYSGMGLAPDTYHAMQAEIPRLHKRVADLEAELAAQRTRTAVDQQALEIVRKEMASQNEEVASLEEGLRFYRSLMAPGEIAQGLSMRPLELVEMEGEGVFGFRIVVQQEARKHPMLQGDLYAEVAGERDGVEVSLPLSQLSDDVEKGTIPLRFRYFQSIDGTMTLPPGFEPRWVNLVATIRTPAKQEVREHFPWRLKEKFTSVGG